MGMKRITQYFMNKNILFREFEKFDLNIINSRKKVDIYCGTTIKNEYYIIFVFFQKSRFLVKNSLEIIELCEKIIEFKKHNFKKRVLLINSPICSKSKEFLKQQNWSVKSDFV